MGERARYIAGLGQDVVYSIAGETVNSGPGTTRGLTDCARTGFVLATPTRRRMIAQDSVYSVYLARTDRVGGTLSRGVSALRITDSRTYNCKWLSLQHLARFSKATMNDVVCDAERPERTVERPLKLYHQEWLPRRSDCLLGTRLVSLGGRIGPLFLGQEFRVPW